MLVTTSAVVSMTADGAGTITVDLRCPAGHLHRIVTGRARSERTAVAVAC